MEITFQVIDKKTGIRIFENTWSGNELDFSVSVSHNIDQKKEEQCTYDIIKHRRPLPKIVQKHGRLLSFLLTFFILCFALISFYFTLSALFDKNSSNFTNLAKWIFFGFTVVAVVLKIISHHYLDDTE